MSVASNATTEISENVSTLTGSSPIKKGQQSVAGHVREEVAERIVKKVIESVDLEKFWELLALKDKRGDFSTNLESDSLKKGESPVDYLNRLSDLVHKEHQEKELICFVNCEHNSFPHPTRSECRPDFVAIRKSRDEVWEQKSVSKKFKDHEWSHLEATGEIRSAGKGPAKAQLQAASYTNYLLQARPDLTHVLGIYVSEKGFRLALSNACGIAYLTPLRWDDESAGPILYAWITRLYDPFKDPTITRVARPNDVTFTLRTADETFSGCRLIKTGIAFGRRTTIFEVPNTSIVIKYQYIEPGRRFSEPATLTHIHDTVPFPGIVQVRIPTKLLPEADQVTVKLERQVSARKGTKKEQKIETRQRTCLVMVDRGMSLMTAETPQAALIAIYDLLEVSRCLYRERSTLHRDISEGNALLRSKPSTTTEEMEKKFKDMHFATSLLGEDGPDPKAGRLQTPLLLIDFDMGEIKGREIAGVRKERTGTPIFMARVVRSGRILSGSHHFPAMPQLEAGLENYSKHLPNRLTTFAPNRAEEQYLEEDQVLEHFQHQLRYDGESAFWLLLWWAVQAKPLTPEDDNNVIRKRLWDDLTCGDDVQDSRFPLVDRFPRFVCHPAYQPLELLLKKMADQLKGDYELLDSVRLGNRNYDEYLHEALQRLIFEFLSQHGRENSPFLTLPKSPDLRKVENGTSMAQPLVTPPDPQEIFKHTPSNISTTKRGRGNHDEDEYSEEIRSSKRTRMQSP
ncbi:hypothetical protein CPB86DRAFT_878448 [Serendipita vermifera]|nr:hypothetical protein CPB86DRAFT_878448 [Serendipita vermifera]